MIFTACALVANRYGASLFKGMNYSTMHASILSTLAKSFEDALKQNIKVELLTRVYAEIQMNITENQVAIDNFIECVKDISESINSDFWNGEDVMAIFFNEFTRYKGKSEKGQVFTPDHITSLIYRITGTNKDDRVLDACCGSGAFLVKAMCNMIRECGGVNSDKAKAIKSNQIYGIEIDREIYALACANMLIHKDGRTNIEQLDSRYAIAREWIAEKKITKVLMNPPFENRYGCLEIVSNVLDSVTRGAICAFIMPDNKLETNKKTASRIKSRHRLTHIIKLPKEIFTGVTTSIFVYKAQESQASNQIFSCYIKDDGFETVKNQGRHDTKNKWQDIENYWADVIYKLSGDESIQWIDPVKDKLAYNMPESPFEICSKDFKKVALEYLLFENQINGKDFKITIQDIK
jgi:type I restriction-modification system DNA methylase subunit